VQWKYSGFYILQNDKLLLSIEKVCGKTPSTWNMTYTVSTLAQN